MRRTARAGSRLPAMARSRPEPSRAAAHCGGTYGVLVPLMPRLKGTSVTAVMAAPTTRAMAVMRTVTASAARRPRPRRPRRPRRGGHVAGRRGPPWGVPAPAGPCARCFSHPPSRRRRPGTAGARPPRGRPGSARWAVNGGAHAAPRESASCPAFTLRDVAMWLEPGAARTTARGSGQMRGRAATVVLLYGSASDLSVQNNHVAPFPRTPLAGRFRRTVRRRDGTVGHHRPSPNTGKGAGERLR
ncbi:hypothetical protein FF36_03264 [Frankia torreyi]|uniref:Uncharacterized protein n=1 Tax=Frankia torreyi TaxID=1856 RepID=A0A0D8BG42_9ACTN|nr:hypothetical protein FF36_03264 [Frankia torreyi]